MVVFVRNHVVVRGFGDGVNVRRHFESILATVRMEDVVGVDWQHSEGVYRDQDVANVGLLERGVGGQGQVDVSWPSWRERGEFPPSRLT